MSTEKFQIKIADKALIDLNNRLKKTRWPDEIPGTGWEFGTNLSQLKELVDYWQGEYDWRKQETELNRLSHFKAEISDMSIHFVHERGKGPDPFPLILTHGYPDSFLRFRKIIPLLTDPSAYGGDPSDSFDIVVPSIPGYGFSDVPNKAGSLFGINDIWAELMTDILGIQTIWGPWRRLGRINHRTTSEESCRSGCWYTYDRYQFHSYFPEAGGFKCRRRKIFSPY
jgi:microsomal epoxide hydrolase